MTPLLTTLLALLAWGSDVSPGRWDKAIAAFEKQDQATPPPQQGIVCVGSSSIRLWNTKQALADLPAINRGFGGSHMGDAAHFADRIVIAYRPRVVVVYGGGNDIASGKSPEQVSADFQSLVGKIHAALPQTKIFYVSLYPSVARLKLDDKLQQANGLIESFTKTDPRLAYIDVRTRMTGPGGGPRPELLRADQLHLNDQGYAVWNEVVVPVVRAAYEQASKAPAGS